MITINKTKWDSIEDFTKFIHRMDEFSFLNKSEAIIVAEWIVVRLKETSDIPEVFHDLFHFIYFDKRIDIDFCKIGVMVNSIQLTFKYYWWPWSSIRKKIDPLIKGDDQPN